MKPYPAYKDSDVAWLGEVPAHWEIRRLKYCFSLITEKANFESGIKLGLENIESWTGNYIETDTGFSGDGTAFQVSDLLFGKLRPYLAKVLLANFCGNAVGDIFVYRHNEEVSPRFSFYRFLSREFIDVVDGSTFGAKMPRTSSEFIGNLPFAYPPLPEQTAITAYLDRKTAQIDAVIARKERMIKLLREERTAVISQAVTKGLNPDAPMKNSGVAWLGEVPAHWEVKRLKHILARNDGGAWGEEGSLDDTPVLRSTEINLDGTWDLVEPARRKLTQKELDATRLISGDLLVTKSSGSSAHIGKTALVTKEVEAMEASFSNFMQRLRLDPAHGPVIYFHFLNNEIGREQLDYLSSTTTGLKNLTAAVLEDVFVTSPPFPEQTAIAAYLDRKTAQIDQTIVRTEAQIERLCEYRTALISAVVTGKVDVREEVEE